MEWGRHRTSCPHRVGRRTTPGGLISWFAPLFTVTSGEALRERERERGGGGRRERTALERGGEGRRAGVSVISALYRDQWGERERETERKRERERERDRERGQRKRERERDRERGQRERHWMDYRYIYIEREWGRNTEGRVGERVEGRFWYHRSLTLFTAQEALELSPQSADI